MKSFLTALKFLTIIPLGKVKGVEDQRKLARSIIYFPLVGILIGSVLVAIDFILKPFFPGSLVNLVILVALVVITGALHLDGFMDSMDGLFSGQNKNRILEIMRDSRVGSFATVALVLLLLLKLFFLNEIQSDIRWPVLILMPALSRWTVIYSAWLYPYARREGGGLGKVFAKSVSKRGFIGATILIIILSGLLLRLKGIITLLIVFGVLFWLTRWINKKIGGMTGDTYGAIIEVVEVVTLITVYSVNFLNL